jgi:hypothetical protein
MRFTIFCQFPELGPESVVPDDGLAKAKPRSGREILLSQSLQVVGLQERITHFRSFSAFGEATLTPMKNTFLALTQGRNLHRKNVEAINATVTTCTCGPVCRSRQKPKRNKEHKRRTHGNCLRNLSPHHSETRNKLHPCSQPTALLKCRISRISASSQSIEVRVRSAAFSSSSETSIPAL